MTGGWLNLRGQRLLADGRTRRWLLVVDGPGGAALLVDLPRYDAHALIPLALLLILGLKRDRPQVALPLLPGQRWTYWDVVGVFAVLSAATFLQVPGLQSVAPVVRYAITGVLRTAIIFLAMFCILRWRHRVPLSALGLRRQDALYQIAWALRVAMAVGVVMGTIATVFYVDRTEWLAIPGPPRQGSLLADWLKQPSLVYWMTVIYYLDLILVTPLVEELLFRALAYWPVARKLGYRGSAVFTSVIFASGHKWTAVRIVATAAIGLFFVYLYHRTRSLLPSLTLHVCGNTVGFVAELLEGLERSIALVLPATGLSLAGFLACSAIVRRTRLAADIEPDHELGRMPGEDRQ